jgi:AcrR family transcriptional regulator
MTRSTKRIPKLRTRGRENRRKLLHEAQRMMLEHNGEPLKFSDVFEAAGVSRGSAYRIYIGMDDLLQDIATAWVSDFVEYLGKGDPEEQPESWTQLSDFVVARGASYWEATAETLQLLPRIRSREPASYRNAVRSMSQLLVEMFDRYFEMPEIPHWSHKLGFYTEICDLTFADAVRTEGYISDQRLEEAQTLCRAYLSFHLPEQLPARKKAI